MPGVLGQFTGTEPATPQTQPAEISSWRSTLTAAIGLDDGRAAELLFAGRLGVAADGWSGLGDAVLLARPVDPAALEGELGPSRREETSGQKVRLYTLQRDHELACDGTTAVVGRLGSRSGLYARTVALLASNERVSLADLAEFQKRTSALRGDAQLIGYTGMSSADARSRDLVMGWWPSIWPRLQSLAVSLSLNLEGVTIELNGRIDAGGPTLARFDPPIDAICRLPETIVAAWSQSIDYVSEFRQIRTTYPQADEHFRFDLLEAGLEPGSLERRLLSHLVGDTILVVDQVEVRPEKARDDKDAVILPAFALLVETDDPDAVAGMLAHLGGNLLRLLKVETDSAEPLPLQEEPVAPGGPVMLTVPLGQHLAAGTKCEFFRSLQISGAVVDRWLVIGTHAETVRRIVQSRRGQVPTLPSEHLRSLVTATREGGGQPRIVLLAQPRAASAMINSWIENISLHHPQLLAQEWWDKLLRRQQASGPQLGIYGRAAAGTVEVVEPMPNSPAHGRVQAGDRILAVDGIRLDSAEPLKSLRESIALRRRLDRITLLIERGGKQQEIEIILAEEANEGPGVHPLELLERAATLCRLFATATHVVWQRSPDELDVRLELRFMPAGQSR